MAFLATRRGLRYGTLMAQLYAADVNPELVTAPELPPVRDKRRHWR